MKRAPITSFRREAYGLVLEEPERRLRPAPGARPKPEDAPATASSTARGKVKLAALDFALLAALLVGAAGFWFAVGKLLVRAWAILVSRLG